MAADKGFLRAGPGWPPRAPSRQLPPSPSPHWISFSTPGNRLEEVSLHTESKSNIFTFCLLSMPVSPLYFKRYVWTTILLGTTREEAIHTHAHTSHTHTPHTHLIHMHTHTYMHRHLTHTHLICIHIIHTYTHKHPSWLTLQSLEVILIPRSDGPPKLHSCTA